MNNFFCLRINKLKKILLGCTLSLVAYNAQADDMQDLYDNGYTLLTEFRKCSVIPDQFSEKTNLCLNNSAKLIAQKTSQFEQKNKVKILQYANPMNNLIDRQNFVLTQKNNCAKIYPEPLQKHFRNQIKSCQVQVDLNRYFYITNTLYSY